MTMSDDLTERRKVVLGVTGSIAAYKSAELARLLISRGYELRVVMTQSAQEFISPLTFQAITGHPVETSFWDHSEANAMAHINLADWADALVIAPASADCLAKLAAGFSDTPLLAIALAIKSPILVAPAMNVNMYENIKTKENIEILQKRGLHFVLPEEGELACGWNGAGRLAESWEIFHNIRRVLSVQDFKGKRIVISSGPTREPIDPVRFISNRSSGKMGVALAREAFRRGADVTLIHGPIFVRVPKAINCVAVTTALELHEQVLAHAFPQGQLPHAVIMAAAVADYRPKVMMDHKLKKSVAGEEPVVELVQNPDVLAELGQRKKNGHPVLVGFAVETGEIEELVKQVRVKLEEKNADMIVGNLAEDALDLDTNRIWMIDKSGRQEQVSTTFKSRVANRILDAILRQ